MLKKGDYVEYNGELAICTNDEDDYFVDVVFVSGFKNSFPFKGCFENIDVRFLSKINKKEAAIIMVKKSWADQQNTPST